MASSGIPAVDLAIPVSNSRQPWGKHALWEKEPLSREEQLSVLQDEILGLNAHALSRARRASSASLLHVTSHAALPLPPRLTESTHPSEVHIQCHLFWDHTLGPSRVGWERSPPRLRVPPGCLNGCCAEQWRALLLCPRRCFSPDPPQEVRVEHGFWSKQIDFDPAYWSKFLAIYIEIFSCSLEKTRKH